MKSNLVKTIQEFNGKELELLEKLPFDDPFLLIQTLAFVLQKYPSRVFELILDMTISPSISKSLIPYIIRYCAIDQVLDFFKKLPKALQLSALSYAMSSKSKQLIDTLILDNPLHLESGTLKKLLHGASSTTVKQLLKSFENESIDWTKIFEHHGQVYVEYLETELKSVTVLGRSQVWKVQFGRMQHCIRSFTKKIRIQVLRLFLSFPPLTCREKVKNLETVDQRCFEIEDDTPFLTILDFMDIKDVLSLLESMVISGYFITLELQVVERLMKRSMSRKESRAMLDYFLGKAASSEKVTERDDTTDTSNATEKVDTLMSSRTVGYHDGYEEIDRMVFWTLAFSQTAIDDWKKGLGMGSADDRLRHKYSTLFKNDLKELNQVLLLKAGLLYRDTWMSSVKRYVTDTVLKFFHSLEKSLYAKWDQIFIDHANGKDGMDKFECWGTAYSANIDMLNKVAVLFLDQLDSVWPEYHLGLHQQISTLVSTIVSSLSTCQTKIGNLCFISHFSVVDSAKVKGPLGSLVEAVKPLFESFVVSQWMSKWQPIVFQYLENALMFGKTTTEYETKIFDFFKSQMTTWYAWLQLSGLDNARLWITKSKSFLDNLKQRTENLHQNGRFNTQPLSGLTAIFGALSSLAGRFLNANDSAKPFFNLNFLVSCFVNMEAHDWKLYNSKGLSFVVTRFVTGTGPLYLRKPMTLDDVFEADFVNHLIEFMVSTFDAENVSDIRVEVTNTILKKLEARKGWDALVVPLVTRVVDQALSNPSYEQKLQMFNLDSWKKSMEQSTDYLTVFEHLFVGSKSQGDKIYSKKAEFASGYE